MKQLSLLLLFLLTALGLRAEEVTAEAAADKAKAFVATHFKHSSRLRKRMTFSSQTPHPLVVKSIDTQSTDYYIFHTRGGSVVVAGDTRLPDILAYSTESQFDLRHLNPAAQAWFDDVAQAAAYARTHDVQLHNAPADAQLPKTVAPLLKTKWSQFFPYNELCPEVNGANGTEYAPTGCVATAVAQIMYYHRYPDFGRGEIAYTTRTLGLPIRGTLEQQQFFWKHMLPTYADNSSNKLANHAVSFLMSCAGKAVQMDYKAGGSGARSTDVPDALVKYFRYDRSVELCWKKHYTDADWKNLLRRELAQQRPVYYFGTSDRGGHAFVCDGYDQEGRFSFNWGWGGVDDGFFHILNTPTTAGKHFRFTKNQGCIISIRPDAAGSPKALPLSYRSMELSALIIPKGKQGGVVSLKQTLALGGYPFKGHVALAVMQGDQPTLFLGEQAVSYAGNEVKTQQIVLKHDEFKARLEPGDYTLVPHSKHEANTTWKPMLTAVQVPQAPTQKLYLRVGKEHIQIAKSPADFFQESESESETGQLTKVAAKVSMMEYWFDGDFESRRRIAASVDNSPSLSVKHLSVGVHKIHYRFVDTQGKYSSVATANFVRNPLPEDEMQLEYWFDDDFAHRVTLGLDTRSKQTFTLSTRQLNNGVHRLNYRFVGGATSTSPVKTCNFFHRARTHYAANPRPMQLCAFVDDKHEQRDTISLAAVEWKDNEAVIKLPITTSDGRHGLSYYFVDNTGARSAWQYTLFDYTRYIQRFSITHEVEGEGDFVIRQGNQSLVNGAEVKAGTWISLFAQPLKDYKLKGVYLNDKLIEQKELKVTQNIHLRCVFEKTTGINAPTVSKKNEEVYGLDGRKRSAAASKHGVVIKDGKKVMR